MKYKIYNNKKGIGIDDAVPWIVLIFVAAVAIVFFEINVQAKDTSAINKIKIKKNILESHEVLMDYLKSFDGQGNNKAELISKSYTQKDYKELKKDMEIYFTSKLRFDYLPEWHIDAVEQNQNTIFFLQSSNYNSEQDEIYQAESIIVPVSGAKPQLITLNLFLGGGK